MSDTAKQLARSPFRVELEGEIITLPGRGLRSMLEIFAHLETQAMRRGSDSCFALDPANPGESQHLFMKAQAAGGDGHGRVTFRDLGRQVLATASAQVRVLQTDIQQIQTLVLINDWTTARRLWSELLANCKTPLFELNFLEELWGIRPERLEVNGWSLTRHWHQIVLIQAEIEILLARGESLLELSNTFERRLGEWLRRFGEILEKIDEESLP